MRERLKKEPGKVIRQYLYDPIIREDSKRSFQNMRLLNLAHVLMLREKQIIPAEDADRIIKVLLEMDESKHSMPLDSGLEDYYYNTEQYLTQKLGQETAGKMHTGRSRNDLHAALARMNVRDAHLRIIGLVLNLNEVLLKLSHDHLDTVLTGYTHLQPAQPISLGHYFLAISQALGRDIDRMTSAFLRLNLSPLGACAFAGTSFPIDRAFTADLLGFGGLVENSIDAVASRDYLVEIESGYALCGSTISRLAADLYCWCTDEFHLVEVDDGLAASSSIMPQKKNPITLEHIRAKSGHLIAGLVSTLASLKSAPYGHNREVSSETMHGFWDVAQEFEAMLELTRETLATLIVRDAEMEHRADINFSTFTEIADEMVKSEGLDFRTSHQIVGKIVQRLLDGGKDAAAVSAQLLREVAKEVLGRELSWSDEKLSRLVSSKNSVLGKISTGGPGRQECERMYQAMLARHFRDTRDLEKMEGDIRSSFARLLELSGAFVSN